MAPSNTTVQHHHSILVSSTVFFTSQLHTLDAVEEGAITNNETFRNSLHLKLKDEFGREMDWRDDLEALAAALHRSSIRFQQLKEAFLGSLLPGNADSYQVLLSAYDAGVEGFPQPKLRETLVKEDGAVRALVDKLRALKLVSTEKVSRENRILLTDRGRRVFKCIDKFYLTHLPNLFVGFERDGIDPELLQMMNRLVNLNRDAALLAANSEFRSELALLRKSVKAIMDD